MARPKGSERRKQRLHSIATASPDSIHPPPEQTQPVPSEAPFNFTSPFPTAQCSGSSASSTSSSSSSPTEAEAEVGSGLANDLTLVRHDSTIESSRHDQSIGAPSIFHGLSLPFKGDQSTQMIYEVQTIGNKLSFKPIAFVSSGLQSGQSADHGIVLVDGQGTLQNTPVAYIFWSLHPEWRLAYDPRSWWCEPREINMRSKMTPPTLQSTDLNPVAGQRSSDLKTWEAGFDFKLFAHSLRLFPDRKPLSVPYTLCGTRASFKAYHDPPSIWRRRKEAADTLDAILSSDVFGEHGHDPLALQNVAKKFFDGVEVPENLPMADWLSVAPSELNCEFVFDKSTYWGQILANRWLEEQPLATFLVDLIMANQMEHACVHKLTYHENKVRRHENYEKAVKNLGSEQSTLTQSPGTMEEEMRESEDRGPENDDILELDSKNGTPTPAPSKTKRKKNKRNNNTIRTTNTPTRNTNEEGPTPAVTPQDSQNAAPGRAASLVADQDEDEDSPPPKSLPEPESLHRLSDSIETEYNADEWEVVEAKATQRNKKRGNARGSVYGIFPPSAPKTSNQAHQTPPRATPPQTSTAPPQRNMQPNPTNQNRPPPSATAASLNSPGKPRQSPTVKKPNPWPIPAATKDATSRVVNPTEYPSMPSTPNASSSPSSRTHGLEGSKNDRQSNCASKRLDDSTSKRAPSIDRASTTKTPAPSTSHSTPSNSKGVEQSSVVRPPFEEQTPTFENPKASTPHGSPPRSKMSKKSPSGRAPSEEQMQTLVVENSNTLTPRQSSGHRTRTPKRLKSGKTPSVGSASAVKVSTAPTSTMYDKQTSGSLPEASDRDAMLLTSAIQPEGSEARPSDDFQSMPEIKAKTPKSTSAPKTSNNGVSVSQDAKDACDTSSATPKLSTHTHIADGGKTTERKQQTPSNDEGTAIEIPAVDKVVSALTDSSSVSTQAYSSIKSRPADGQASNDSTPRTTTRSPFTHKSTQSLPENQSQKTGIEGLDPTRPVFVANGPNGAKNTLDLQESLPGRPSPSPKATSGGIVKKKPGSKKRKSQPRQDSFDGQMNAQPRAFGQNNYSTNVYPYGLPPVPVEQFGPMAMVPTPFGSLAPPFQPSLYGSHVPHFPQPPLHPRYLGYPGYTNPPINPMMNAFGNHSAMSGTYDNGPKERATIGWQELNSPEYNGGDSLPWTPQDEHKGIADGNMIPKSRPTDTAAHDPASGSPKVDLDNVPQVEVVQGSQGVGPGDNDDTVLEFRDIKGNNAPSDDAPLKMNNKSNDVADDLGPQPDSRHENPPSDHGDHGQGKNLEDASLLNTLLGPQKTNATGSEIPTKTETNEEDSKASRRLEYPGTFCTFCTRECPADGEKPGSILCSGCGPLSNICYCSEACIVGDAYDHKVHCQMYPSSQRPLVYKIRTLGCHLYEDPIMPMEPYNDSPEKFRQKTFMMYCPGDSFPKILKAWGRRESNEIPEGVDVDENGKQTGSYFVFRSEKTAPTAAPHKVFLSSKNLVVDRFNHNADVIFTVKLPMGSPEKDLLSRALNCCFLSNVESIKESLFRLIRHFILDESEFNRLKHEEPQKVVFEEFQHQFAKEFRFNVAAVDAEKSGYTLESLIEDEWKRCGEAIRYLQRHNDVLDRWRPRD